MTSMEQQQQQKQITLTLTEEQLKQIGTLGSERTLEQQVQSIFKHGLRDVLYRRERQRKQNLILKAEAEMLAQIKLEHPELVETIAARLR